MVAIQPPLANYVWPSESVMNWEIKHALSNQVLLSGSLRAGQVTIYQGDGYGIDYDPDQNDIVVYDYQDAVDNHPRVRRFDAHQAAYRADRYIEAMLTARTFKPVPVYTPPDLATSPAAYGTW